MMLLLPEASLDVREKGHSTTAPIGTIKQITRQ